MMYYYAAIIDIRYLGAELQLRITVSHCMSCDVSAVYQLSRTMMETYVLDFLALANGAHIHSILESLHSCVHSNLKDLMLGQGARTSGLHATLSAIIA
eukprot:6189187-Pleurochrysis_carterae.AAC.1